MKNLFSNNSFVVIRRSFIILIVLSLLIAGCSSEEETTTSNLTGKVIDDTTGKPLANCIISVEDEMTQTNQNGLFMIKNLQAGNYQINITKLDAEKIYEENQESITISDNQDSKINIKLKQRSQMTTQKFWDSNRSNTGSFKVANSNRTGPDNNFALLYPSDLKQGPFPVITWGNGTGAIPEFYWGLLNNLASNGFIIIAPRSTNTGKGEEMMQGINWLIKENNNPSSKFHNTINVNNIGAAGHSQGGGGALNVGSNSKIKTTILIEPARFGGSTRQLNGTTFIISGGRDFIVPSYYVRLLFYRPTQVPTIYGHMHNASHFTPVGDGGKMAKYITAWFKAKLQADQQAQNLFQEGKGIFNDNDWEVSTKENNQLF